MSDDVQVWMVERTYTDKGLVTTVYATADGEHKIVEQLSAKSPREVTAGQRVPAERLDESDPEERERFAQEAQRMAEKHDPDDAV